MVENLKFNSVDGFTSKKTKKQTKQQQQQQQNNREKDKNTSFFHNISTLLVPSD